MPGTTLRNVKTYEPRSENCSKSDAFIPGNVVGLKRGQFELPGRT